MTRKSYAALQGELLTLQQKFLTLATDPETGVMSRRAYELDFEALDRQTKTIMILYVEAASSGALKRLLHLQHPGTIARVRWNDRLFLFLVKDDPESLFDRLNAGMRSEMIKGHCFGLPNKNHNIPLSVEGAQEGIEKFKSMTWQESAL